MHIPCNDACLRSHASRYFLGNNYRDIFIAITKFSQIPIRQMLADLVHFGMVNEEIGMGNTLNKLLFSLRCNYVV